MKKTLLFLVVFLSALLITFSTTLYFTSETSILGDEYEMLGAKSGFIDGEVYTVGVRFYNGSYYNELKASTTLAASNTWYLPTVDGTDGQVLKTDGSGNLNWTTIAGGGSVTYVGLAVPTGLTVSGTPITTSGTTTIALASGYEIPKTASTTNWETAYGWGNHATAGYITQAYASSTYQPIETYITQAYASTTYGLIASNNTWTGQNTFGNASTTNLTVSTNSELGTIDSGTWNGTAIGVAYGGTGLTGISAGGLLYGSALNTIGVLASSTNGYYLAINSSGYPAWQKLTISYGSSGYTNSAGDIFGDSTSGQFRFNDGTATRTLTSLDCKAVSIASSTWNNMSGIAGTSTIMLDSVAQGYTMASSSCQTDTGTAIMAWSNNGNTYGTTSLSNTAVDSTYTTNNVYTLNSYRALLVGSITASTNWIFCGVCKTITPD